MRVKLAGFNVDADILRQLELRGRRHLTPETLSAAYARISRSPLPVDQLRKKACLDVEKARSSNQKIIFAMGHHSVAEHAVFNFDIMGISRLALEEIEKFRLVSYTEKSQRYVTLEGDLVLPGEIRDAGQKKLFLETVQKQNRFYFKAFALLNKRLQRQHRDMVKSRRRPEARGGLGQGRRPLHPVPGQQRPGGHDHQRPQPRAHVPPPAPEPPGGGEGTRRKTIRPGPAHRALHHPVPRTDRLSIARPFRRWTIISPGGPDRRGRRLDGNPRSFPIPRTATT